MFFDLQAQKITKEGDADIGLEVVDRPCISHTAPEHGVAVLDIHILSSDVRPELADRCQCQEAVDCGSISILEACRSLRLTQVSDAEASTREKQQT